MRSNSLYQKAGVDKKTAEAACAEEEKNGADATPSKIIFTKETIDITAADKVADYTVADNLVAHNVASAAEDILVAVS